jgi:hypothetical protein
MTPVKAFILMGIVQSYDNEIATVELNTNPPTAGLEVTARMPVPLLPCEIKEGKVFYVIKVADSDQEFIVCEQKYPHTVEVQP